MSTFVAVMAQVNPLVGDIAGNTQKVLASAREAKEKFQADLVVFPELTLTGYPPEDLLLRPSLERRIERALDTLMQELVDVLVVIGYPRKRNGRLYNMAGVIHRSAIVAEYAKQCLPNYQVFDEKRYFAEGQGSTVFTWHGHTVALTVCEDIWHPAPVEQAKMAGADLVVNLNASPFHRNKQAEREAMLSERARQAGAPIIYVNQVGGQDELVFDGGSAAVTASGDVAVRAPAFDEGLFPVTLHSSNNIGAGLSIATGEQTPYLEPCASVYQALVLGVRDYVNKNGFNGVVLGLSGGIDSALTLAIAVDALGADCVEAVMMPFRYTSALSRNDAADQARRMGVSYRIIDIEPVYDAFVQALADAFTDTVVDKTEENLQARSRGVLLMALSNKRGQLVLTTGNKSEMAVGYATLYGDMAGGFSALKDVPKTLVFKLAAYRNSLAAVIPETVISRPPSAELAPDQKDEDSLPPYDVLDQILELYIERDFSADDIAAQGFDADVVRRVLRLVDINEYKRRQSAIGVRISQRGFGRDRRYPITNGWILGD